MKYLVVLLEELSAKAAFEGLLPRILPNDVDVQYVVFEGKSDLRKQLPNKLQHWNRPHTSFLVMCDQDNENCRSLKDDLTTICHNAKKPHTVVRIACRELESWYFGDLAAVERGLAVSGVIKHAAKSRYRTPDGIKKPAQQLIKITAGSYQKVAGSRAIGPHLHLNNNTSPSFRQFIAGVTKAVSRCP